MALNKTEKAQLTSLIQHDAWELLAGLADERVRFLKDQDVVGQNAFEELRMLHKNQGKAEGLVEFFKDVEEGNV